MNDSVLRHKLLSAFTGCVIAIVVSSCTTVDTAGNSTPPSESGAAEQAAAVVATDNSASAAEGAAVEQEGAPAEESSVTAPVQAPVPVRNEQPEEQAAEGSAEEPMTGKTVTDSESAAAVSEQVAADVESAAAAEAEADTGDEIPLPEDIPPNTFYVTSGPKDPSHFYYGIGSDQGLIVNGVQGKELVVVRGQTYTFNVNTDIKHDFYLSTSPRGWGASTLTDGVKGNFTYRGIVTFTPNENTPDVVYYQCRNHKNMGSKIHVVDPGEEDSVVFGVHDETPSTMKRPKVDSAFTGSGTQAKQKVMFAEMFISKSPAARRIDASNNARAKQLLADARLLLDKARSAQAAGDDAAAIDTVNEALRNMTEASQLVPSESQRVELQAHYEELLHAAHTYEKSYRRNLKLMQKKGKKDLPDLDIDKVSATIAEAEKLADNDQLVEANQLLAKLQRTITGALTQLLAEETMDYTLTFDTPKEEYEYELARYKSYEELIPIAIEQKRPSKQSRALMDSFVDKAKGIYELSGPKAGEGDYTTAIQMLQGATSHLQRALRIVGVR
jgi:hypothetical protein